VVPGLDQEQLNADLAKINYAFEKDPLLRISQATVFIANRLSLLGMLVIRDRLRKAGVNPTSADVALRGMLRDQDLITATIGPFEMERLETEVDKVLPHYIATLHAAGVNLADVDPTHDNGKSKPPASDNSGTASSDSGSGGSSSPPPTATRSKLILPG
jgi:hypothetical protein